MMKMLIALITLICFGIQVNAQTSKKDTDFVKEFITVQVEAKFPGGPSAWAKYLEQNLNTSIATKVIKLKRGQQSAQQTAVVSFLVDKKGNISQVAVLNPGEIHRKLAAEAIRVIENGPKWIPAIQNGRNVIYRQKQNITFEVTRD
jgi:protein TonB